MKKFILNETLNILALKEKAKSILKNTDGSSVLSDHAGMVIVGILAIIGVIVWQGPFISNTLLPLLGQRLQDLFNH